MFRTFQTNAISKRFRYAQYFAGAGLALSLAVSAAHGPKAAADAGTERTYKPIQAISYVLGSKRAIGHFSPRESACEVVLMVAEVVDPEVATPTSAARLRLTLNPGQAAGLDSEEGQSIDLTCGPDAATLRVRQGNWIAATH